MKESSVDTVIADWQSNLKSKLNESSTGINPAWWHEGREAIITAYTSAEIRLQKIGGSEKEQADRLESWVAGANAALMGEGEYWRRQA
jgi:hypothetical protein